MILKLNVCRIAFAHVAVRPTEVFSFTASLNVYTCMFLLIFVNLYFYYTYYTVIHKCNKQQLLAIRASYENKHRPFYPVDFAK